MGYYLKNIYFGFEKDSGQWNANFKDTHDFIVYMFLSVMLVGVLSFFDVSICILKTLAVKLDHIEQTIFWKINITRYWIRWNPLTNQILFGWCIAPFICVTLSLLQKYSTRQSETVFPIVLDYLLRDTVSCKPLGHMFVIIALLSLAVLACQSQSI